MNPDQIIPGPEVFEDAERRIPEIERRITDNAIIAGKKHARDIVEDDSSREFVARLALSEALAATDMPETPRAKGPALTRRPKVSARKRQRQARRRQR